MFIQKKIPRYFLLFYFLFSFIVIVIIIIIIITIILSICKSNKVSPSLLEIENNKKIFFSIYNTKQIKN